MKKLSLFLTLALFFVLAAPAAYAQDAPDRGVTLNVYNWGEYIANGTDGSMDVNAEFTRRTGIRVNYTTFDSNESLYSKLAAASRVEAHTAHTPARHSSRPQDPPQPLPPD